MRRGSATLLVFLVAVALVIGSSGCGETRGQDYRQTEAVAAVHAYLFILARGEAANDYVHTQINDACWATKYNSANESWEVYTYDHCPNTWSCDQTSCIGLTGGTVAHWYVYGSDMSIIDSSEWEAALIKSHIEELNNVIRSKIVRVSREQLQGGENDYVLVPPADYVIVPVSVGKDEHLVSLGWYAKGGTEDYIDFWMMDSSGRTIIEETRSFNFGARFDSSLGEGTYYIFLGNQFTSISDKRVYLSVSWQ